MDARNVLAGLTALHLAARRGYSRVVELLVGFGADINMADYTGQTIMHMVLANKDTAAPSSDGETPELEKVCSYIGSQGLASYPRLLRCSFFLLRKRLERRSLGTRLVRDAVGRR